MFHLGTAFQCETPVRFALGDRGRFILKRAFRRETENRGRRAAMSSISARFALGTAAALHERQQEDSEMKRTQAIAIGLATVLMTAAAHAAPDREEVQAPRGQDVQAPRGQDVQAPRGQHDAQEETNVKGGTTDELV
jgi:GAF domain-containing protein